MHLINKLYTSEFDFPVTSKSSSNYMIAAIPRSGSTYLALKLWQTGVLGAPMEYLNLPAIAKQLMPRLGFGVRDDWSLFEEKEIRDYWENVKRIRTSPNGVFGYKIFMKNIVDLMSIGSNLFELISPDYIIYLTRNDDVGQAISYSKALRTNVWFADTDNVPKVDYDYAHIEHCKHSLQKQYEYWENMFSMAGIDIIRVSYEDLMSNENRVMDTILAEMQVRREESKVLSIPTINRQSDSISSKWRDLYESDRLAI